MARHYRRPPPRAHWLLLALTLSVVTALLALNALVSGGLGTDSTAGVGPAGTVPDAVRSGGPVIDADREPPLALRPPDLTLALTFDDGPDPRWTPQVLEVLARHGAHATFFVTGAQAARNPDLIETLLRAGHEVAHHTFTHADLRDTGPLRTWLEMRATDLVLAHTTGSSTSLFRPPYSSEPSAVDDASWRVATELAGQGRLTVLSTVDSEDWRTPGVDAIVANSTPPDQRGAVLLMHDAGGDRSQTVEALDRLLPSLYRAGWRVDTVSRAIGASGSSHQASMLDRVSGAVLVGAVQAAKIAADLLHILLTVAIVLAAARTVVMLVTTFVHVRRTRRTRPEYWDAPVTVIVPAYNEEAGIAATVRSILASRHHVEVVVVDDGSTDRTAAVVAGLREPRVRLIRQANAGKAAALNTGIAAARTELVVVVDGDTVLDPRAVGAMAGHFADPRLGAVSGNAKVGNRGGLLGRWQHIEYVVGFNLDRRMYDVLQCMPTVPGAVGMFRRSALREVGGVPEETLAEDTDLTMSLERAGWRVTYEQRAIAWTEAPASLGQLWKQRYRWCYGTLQAVWKHKGAVLEGGAGGKLGRRGLPYLLLFQVALPVIAPVVDVATVFGLLTGDVLGTALVFIGFLALQGLPAVIAFRLDGERLAPLAALPLQQFVYRQLMYLVVFQSLATAINGVRLGWQKLDRTGSAAPVR